MTRDRVDNRREGPEYGARGSGPARLNVHDDRDPRRPGVGNLVLAIAVYQIPQFARVVRAVVLTIRQEPFVETALALGMSDWRLIDGPMSDPDASMVMLFSLWPR